MEFVTKCNGCGREISGPMDAKAFQHALNEHIRRCVVDRILYAVREHAEGGNIENYGMLAAKLDAIVQGKTQSQHTKKEG